MSRNTVSEFRTPAVHHATAVMSDLEPRAGARKDFTIYITHFVTPETHDTTHYWFAFARDFAIDDPEVSDYMVKGAITAFNEDKFALEEISRIHKLEPESSGLEIHIKSDQAGVATRRILRRLAEGQ